MYLLTHATPAGDATAEHPTSLALHLTAALIARLQRVSDAARTLETHGETIYGTDVSDSGVQPSPFEINPAGGVIADDHGNEYPYWPVPDLGSGQATQGAALLPENACPVPGRDSAFWDDSTSLQGAGLRVDAQVFSLFAFTRGGVRLNGPLVSIDNLLLIAEANGFDLPPYPQEVQVEWTLEDVRKVRPDLDAYQAAEVLCEALSEHDQSSGLTWDGMLSAAAWLDRQADEDQDFNPDTDSVLMAPPLSP